MESRLIVFYAELAVDGGQYALHLSHGEHASQERVACIVAALFVAEHRHAMGDGRRAWAAGGWSARICVPALSRRHVRQGGLPQ